jgi:hypothetical protein
MGVVKVADYQGGADSYSVPEQTRKVFEEGILRNPLVAKDLPRGYEDYSRKVSFKGSDFPSLAINWRFAESISALKGLEAVFLNALLVEKYGVEPQEIVVDTLVL